MMKRLILVSAMILGLAATGAFAAQNKNSKPASKPAASSNTGGTMKSSGGGKHHRRRHHRKSKGSAASTGNMSSKPSKSKNSK
jgi:Spy/CpxP family protein refolding chaperone